MSVVVPVFTTFVIFCLFALFFVVVSGLCLQIILTFWWMKTAPVYFSCGVCLCGLASALLGTALTLDWWDSQFWKLAGHRNRGKVMGNEHLKPLPGCGTCHFSHFIIPAMTSPHLTAKKKNPNPVPRRKSILGTKNYHLWNDWFQRIWPWFSVCLSK